MIYACLTFLMFSLRSILYNTIRIPHHNGMLHAVSMIKRWPQLNKELQESYEDNSRHCKGTLNRFVHVMRRKVPFMMVMLVCCKSMNSECFIWKLILYLQPRIFLASERISEIQ